MVFYAMKNYKFMEALLKRKNLLDKYGKNARLLYALELRYGLEDIDSVASEALTDNSDDQKCDLLYINEEENYAVIAQAYECETDNKGAPENKATDLNTAITWIFSDDINASFIPTTLKEAIISFQENMNNDNINTIHLWYVHNCDESKNHKIKNQLEKVKENALARIKEKYPQNRANVEFIEVGTNQLESWYQNSNKRILVEEELTLEITDGFKIDGENWSAFVTAVKGPWLKDLYGTYGDDIFSGNPRNFLGAQTKKLSINSGIKKTITEEADNFWPFNNGITALVNSFSFDAENKKLTIKGITIINGAQTTGAIASSESKNCFYVPIRFIDCKKDIIIQNIILNNNKQNEILTSDMRSNDIMQTKLRQEFAKYPTLFYNGGRRSDKKPAKAIVQFDNYLVGQLLHAFHFDAYTAYNKRKYLWQEDELYDAIFTDSLSPEHIIFLYSLSKAIDEFKNTLKSKGNERTEKENNNYEFLRKRGTKMLLVSAISRCMETILARKVSNKFDLQFKDNDNFDKCVETWYKLLLQIIIYHKVLSDGLDDGLKNKTNIDKAINTYSDTIVTVKESIGKPFAEKFVKAIKK